MNENKEKIGFVDMLINLEKAYYGLTEDLGK